MYFLDDPINLFLIIILNSIPINIFLKQQMNHLEKYLKQQGIVSVQFNHNTAGIVFQEKVSETLKYQLVLQSFKVFDF